MTVTVITTDLKKGRLAPKDLEADVGVPNDRSIIIILKKTKQQLDRSPRIHPGVGSVIRYDGAFYLCTSAELIFVPAQYRLTCHRLG